MARPQNEERPTLLAAVKAIARERLMCPLEGTDGDLLIGATGQEMAQRAQVGWATAIETIKNMVVAGELLKLGKHRPEWSARAVWVYAAATPQMRWAQGPDAAMNALEQAQAAWVKTDEPLAAGVASQVPAGGAGLASVGAALAAHAALADSGQREFDSMSG